MTTASRSEGEAIAQRLRDEECVRGCTLPGIHWATCPDFAAAGEGSCRGCAPAPAHPESVICVRCFGRMRGLLRDAPDLVARLRSLSDPAKAMQIAAVKISSRPVDAVAPVGPDLLDAADTILANLRDWALVLATATTAPRRVHTRSAGLLPENAATLAAGYAQVIVQALPEVCTDVEQTLRLAEAVLVIHPDVDGARSSWSIADAATRWGIERRDRHVHPDVDAPPDRELVAWPVHEWYDPILTVKDAAERAGVAERTVRTWVSSGELPVVMRVRGPRGSVLTGVRASAVDRVAGDMASRRHRGRRPTPTDTPVSDPVQE